jgi:DsbC/DsbD-like thiol-disulfide interchange protein
MTSLVTRRWIIGVALPGALAAPAILSSSPVRAADASPWSASSHSAIRLLGGGTMPGKPGLHLAAIAIRMNRGFKTYWRHPGDTGVPPVFRFETSENVASAEVRFPAPLRFPDGAGGFSIGYQDEEVIFPVHVTARDASAPVMLRLSADYAVCEKLCVPASGQAELALPARERTAQTATIRAADIRVPQLAKLGAKQPLSVMALRKGAEQEQVLVDIQTSGAAPVLFMEGEQPWFFEPRAAEPKGNGLYTATVAVIERSKAADCTGADVTLTVVAGASAIEVKTRLDLSLVTQ